MAKKKTVKKKVAIPRIPAKEKVIILSINGTLDDVLKASIPAVVPNKK